MVVQKHIIALLACMSVTALCSAGSPEEAAKLGTEFTCWGAPKGASGGIPAWAGNPKAPAGFKPGSGVYPNPFPDDKPILKITQANMAQYADKLSEVQKEILKRHADYRLDVYPTRRTYAEPAHLCDAARKNVVTAKLEDGGSALVNAFGAIPFPFPKTGHEVMWNHLTAWRGEAWEFRYDTWYTDSNGTPVLTATNIGQVNFPYYYKGKSSEWLKSDVENYFYLATLTSLAPARSVGEATINKANLTPLRGVGNRSWSYQPGQRRVRLTPNANYDFPIASQGGAITYDDVQVFYGAPDRFNFKLIGKKEMYIPYNNSDYVYATNEKLLSKNFVNPDVVRWELHRVWVVEATLKPEFRHIYSKRVFYFDEDNVGAGMSDQYDMSGKLYRGVFQPVMPMYDQEYAFSSSYFGYDLSSNAYVVATRPTNKGYVKNAAPNLELYQPQSLQTRSQR